MAGIVTESVSPNSCGHRTLTVDLDGDVHTVHIHDDEAAVPLDSSEKAVLLRYLVRHRRAIKGWLPSELAGRAIHGDEATNVKTYDFLGPGSAVTKSNIGTAYVNVCPGLNGERILVDFTGCTEFRVIANINVVGTGQVGVRIVRDSDSAPLWESANVGAAGEREVDSGWLPLPAAASGLALARLQGKSTAGADDPTFRRVLLICR